MSIILSIDVGTGSVKAGLFDTQALSWLGVASHRLGMYRCGPIAEQDAREYLSAADHCVGALQARCGEALSRVSIVGLTGQMRTVVLVDEAHEPIGPALTLYDRRAEAEFDTFVAAFGLQAIYRITGQRCDVASTPAKLRWLARNAGERLSKCWKLLAPKDYLRLRLTGRAATEPIDAGGWLLWDVVRGIWSEALAAFAGIRIDQLPEVIATCSVAGTLLPEIAGRWGLPAHTPVSTGGGDDIAATGCGATRLGDVYEHLGSTGSIFVVTDRPVLDPEMIVECYPTQSPDRYWVGGSCNSAGIAIEHALRLSPLCRDAEIDWACVHRCLGDWHVKAPAARPMYLPYVAGERCPVWNARLRAAWLDIEATHDASDWVIAAHEGPTLVLAWICQELKRLGLACHTIYSAGRAGADESFARLRAAAYGHPICRMGQPDAALFAAAQLAAVAAGEAVAPADLNWTTQRLFTAEPDTALSSGYAERLTLFQQRTREHLRFPPQ